MKGKSKQKTSAPRRNSLDSMALPGSAGLAVMEKLKNGQYEDALNIFYQSYIGDLGSLPQLRVLEDDGNVIIITGQRGPFRFTGEGRTFFLMVIEGITNRLNRPQE